MSLRHVVFDFDGTCTRVEDVAKAYEERCIEIFTKEVAPDSEPALRKALDRVRAASPGAGWMLGGAPAAPAAADPYIMFGEAMRIVQRELHIPRAKIPDTIHARANDECEAPWRAEVGAVLAAFHAKDITIHFVSNSSTKKIEGRLDALLGADTALRKSIRVLGDAGKFVIREIEDESVTRSMVTWFQSLAPSAGLVEGRPLYLRRGGYFEALCKVWNQENHAAQTLVCGDIFELDLAMPIALGAQVHMVRREEPYPTYAYEIDAVKALGERGSYGSLEDVLARF